MTSEKSLALLEMIEEAGPRDPTILAESTGEAVDKVTPPDARGSILGPNESGEEWNFGAMRSVSPPPAMPSMGKRIGAEERRKDEK